MLRNWTTLFNTFPQLPTTTIVLWGLLSSWQRNTCPFRKVYIPTWDENCNDLFLEFQKSGKNRVVDELIRTLNINRRNKWHDTTVSLNFTHSSRKAWNIVKRLDAETPKTGQHGAVNPNDVATIMMRVAKAKMDKEHKIQIKRLLQTKKKELIPSSNYSSSFTVNEIKVALRKRKLIKQPVLTEYTQNFSSIAAQRHKHG